MAIREIGERVGQRKAVISTDSRDYTRMLVVVCDDLQDGAVTIIQKLAAAPPTPADAAAITIGCPYQVGNDTDLGSTCRRIEPRLIAENELAWDVTCDWSSKVDQGGQPDQDPDPLRRPPEVSWSFDQFVRPVQIAKFFGAVNENNAFVRAGRPGLEAPKNSALDNFTDPAPEKDDSRPVVTVKANLPFVPIWILNYNDAVNSDAFVVDGVPIAVGQAKVRDVSVGPWKSEKVGDTEIRYREASISIHLRAEGWDEFYLDQGYHLANRATNQKLDIKDDQGQIMNSPQLLDGFGEILRLAGVPVFQKYRIYLKRLPFRALDLP